MNKDDKILGLIGLAQKAGMIVSGEFSCEKAIKNHTAKLVIVAKDASDNTKKSFSDSCTFYKIDYTEFSTKDSLGHCIGKQFRASLAITDEKMAANILDKMNS